MEQFYKVVTPDLASFHDPTFTYAIGKTVRRRDTGTPELCTTTVLHASRQAPDAAQYGRWPYRLLTVKGVPVVEQDDKAGFRQLRVIAEADVALCFGPNGAAVVDVLETVGSASGEQLDRLAASWDAAGYAAWSAAGYAAGYAARDAAWDAARAAARDAARAAAVADLIGQHDLEQHHIETLMAPYVEVFGRPDWMLGERR